MSIAPFRLEIAQQELDDLRDRLRRTRWPEREPVEDWSQGIPLGYMRELVGYWAEQYDWRRVEARLNELPQFRTEIDGLGIHFLHVRSPVPEAQPLVMTGGWPGSIVEFLDVIGPLTDPAAHGGDPADAFHVVCPSLPGHGFSDKPATTGWGLERIARAWAELMRRLGYDRYAVHGGDWGWSLALLIPEADPDHVVGVHVTTAVASREALFALGDVTDEERHEMSRVDRYMAQESGYSAVQSTRPQTLAYALADSPAGQCAWIVEKFRAWTDCDGHPENVFSRDLLLDNVMMYWLPNAGGSSGRLYWESFAGLSDGRGTTNVPVGYSVFPKDLVTMSERWARTRFPHLIHYKRHERGGHYAALERPDAFVADIRATFRTLRG